VFDLIHVSNAINCRIDIGKNSLHIIGHDERGSIAAVHGFCRSWVISGQTISRQKPPLSAVAPITDIRRCKGPTGSIDVAETLDGRQANFIPSASRRNSSPTYFGGSTLLAG